MNLRKTLSALKAKYIPTKLKLTNIQFLGKDLIVYEGTIGKTDKDDAWLYALAAHHDHIYDVGANLGSASIHASIHDPLKKIILIDPNPYALDHAAGNLIRNSMAWNKMFIASFVSDKTGDSIKFYSAGLASAGSMYQSHSKTIKSVNAYYWVETLTLDEIYNRTGLLPGLVKIDVEGAEGLVVKGASKIAAQKQTKFLIEMHAPPELSMKQNAQNILDWCKANAYDAYYLKTHTRLEDAATIAHRGRCHLLLLPGNTPYPDYIKGIKEGAQPGGTTPVV